MAHIRRGSVSSTRSESPMVFAAAVNSDIDQWMKTWHSVPARSLIEAEVTTVDADTSVEDACETLLSSGASCLAIQSTDNSYHGLFDYSDVNAFLVLAATRHRSTRDGNDNTRAERIIAAATAGHVPIQLVSNLSDKNPLVILPHDSDLVSLLAVFSRGAHRVLIRAPPPSTGFLGIVSDRGALGWFASQTQNDPAFMRYLSNPINCLAIPSLYLYSSVVSVSSIATTLDAMTLMSDEGVSAVAVIDEDQGHLLSALSVTDIARIVVPSEDSQILFTSVLQLVARIKDAIGATDGADRYPVYSVIPSSNLIYTIHKLLATNSHRLFITDDFPNSPSPTNSPNSLSGVISTVDILSLFAVLANIPDVDPTQMQRHRRASSSSTTSSSPRSSPRDFGRSRSNSRASVGRSSGDFKAGLESFQRK